jgi:hypothetical protein
MTQPPGLEMRSDFLIEDGSLNKAEPFNGHHVTEYSGTVSVDSIRA